jgi:uncharacterized protein
MRPFSGEFQVFAKPVGAQCNLDCAYCYYVERNTPPHPGRPEVMPDELLERYIRQHLEADPGPVVIFSWHGGEPTLAGIDFYQRAIEFQEKYRKPGVTVMNGIQTNGTLINKEWCEFFKKESFFVGISMDGPPPLHDRFRLSKGRKPTHGRVLRGYRLLQEWGIPTEILCVVNAVNVKFPLEVYGYFRETGARNLTFLPLVERMPEPPGPPGHSSVPDGPGLARVSSRSVTAGPGVARVSSRSVPARDFGRFLCTVFDEWLEKDIGKIKVQIFEEAARTAFHQDHTLCIFKKRCGAVPVVERNGDFFSCDHFTDQDHMLGNIREHHLGELLGHPQQSVFGESKETTLPRWCRECGVLGMCNGECPKNRFVIAPDGEPGLNYLCEGYKMFFSHCRPFVDAVAGQFSQPPVSP